MVWVRLRLPRLQRIVEFLCLLPLTIPAIVLVVGLVPIYQWIPYLTTQAGLPGSVGDSPLTLALAYVILVLPYSYRAIDTGLAAIDVRTLSEAARSLGASWPTIMLRVITPNISTALLNAGLLTVALVLGEYTFARILNFYTLQFAIAELGRTDAGVSIAVSLASQIFAFALLLALSFVGARRGASRRQNRRQKENS
jgi:putative spermidine/putrescine transport system permease protein